MSHSDRFISKASISNLFSRWRPFLQLLEKNGEILKDLAAFADLYGRFLINGFVISDYFDGDLGRGLYLGPSILNHSCVPNAIQIFEGKRLIIKATRAIESIEEVRLFLKQAAELGEIFVIAKKFQNFNSFRFG